MLGVFAFIAAAFVLFWLESRLGLWKLKRDLKKQGWRLISARWRMNLWPERRVPFVVEVERECDGRHGTGMAYVGGPWTGPMWSSRVEYEWDDGSLTR